MAYRDEVGIVMSDNAKVRKAIEQARWDATFTRFRQVLLAFAFGLSWSVLGRDSSAADDAHFWCTPPPRDHGWVTIRPVKGSTFVVDDEIRGAGVTRIALRPGTHHVRFSGIYGEHCSTVQVSDGRSAFASEDDYGSCR